MTGVDFEVRRHGKLLHVQCHVLPWDTMVKVEPSNMILDSTYEIPQIPGRVFVNNNHYCS